VEPTKRKRKKKEKRGHDQNNASVEPKQELKPHVRRAKKRTGENKEKKERNEEKGENRKKKKRRSFCSISNGATK